LQRQKRIKMKMVVKENPSLQFTEQKEQKRFAKIYLQTAMREKLVLITQEN